MPRVDVELLQAALIGYETELKRLKENIAEIQARLGRRGGGRNSSVVSSTHPKKNQHRISPEGRARIAEAQRRRWAKAKRGQS